MNRKSETPENFGCLKGVEKSELFSQETYHSQNFRYETLKSPLLKILSVYLLSHFVWKLQTIKGTFLSFSLIREWMNMNEYMIELWCFWSTDFREPLLSFEFIYFRNSFCYRIENGWGFRHKILGHVGLLGKTLKFCLPWDRWNFRIFKTFPKHFELCLSCKYWRSYEVL